MRELTPEEKRALIENALSQKFSADPTQRYPQLAKATTQPPVAPPMAPPPRPVAPPPAPKAPLAALAEEPPDLGMPSATAVAEPPPEPMKLPEAGDVVGQYTPEAREELRAKLQSKARIGLLPGLLSVVGDAGANSSGMGQADTLGSIIKRSDEQMKEGLADFDTSRKQKVEDYLTGIKARTAGREEAVETDNADPASALSDAKRKVLQTLGYTDDLSNLSGAQMDPIIKSYLTKYTADQDAEAKRLTREAQAGEKAQKREEQLKALEIPGFRNTGKVAVDDQEAKKLREGLAEYKDFKQALAEYRRMIEEHGTTEVLDRNTLMQMESLSTMLQLKAKNAAQLGVLSASDIPFITKQIPGPGFFKTQAGMLGALKQSEDSADRSLKNRMSTRGYEAEGETEGGPQPGAVEDGYRFKGGDAGDPNNWEPA